MKTMVKLVGIIAFIAVIGFGMAACDDGNKTGTESINGTWVSSSGGETQKIVLNNGAMTMSQGNTEIMKGTFVTSGSNFTLTVLQIKGEMFGEYATQMGIDPTTWYTKTSMRAAILQLMITSGMDPADAEAMVVEEYDEMINGYYFTWAGTYKLNGNKLTLTVEGDSTTLTRQ